MSRKNLRLTERDFKEGNLVRKNEGRKGAEDGVAGVGGAGVGVGVGFWGQTSSPFKKRDLELAATD